MKFFFIESEHAFVNIENVSDIRFKDYCVMVRFGEGEFFKYTLTDDERKKFIHFLAQNSVK